MPAGDRAVAPVAVSGARPGQHDGVASVREQLQPRRLAMCEIMHGTWTPDRRPPFTARRWKWPGKRHGPLTPSGIACLSTEERRVGEESVIECRCRWAPDH